MISLKTMPKWEPLRIDGMSPEQVVAVTARMEQIFLSWDGTPHVHGQQCKGVACDCVRFIAAVLDELEGVRRKLEVLPHDVSFHNPELAWRGFRAMLSLYQTIGLEKDAAFQPGDVLIVGPKHGGPGHAIIVGTNRDLWHSDSGCVGRTGLGLVNIESIMFKKAFRISNRQSWSR